MHASFLILDFYFLYNYGEKSCFKIQNVAYSHLMKSLHDCHVDRENGGIAIITAKKRGRSKKDINFN